MACRIASNSGRIIWSNVERGGENIKGVIFPFIAIHYSVKFVRNFCNKVMCDYLLRKGEEWFKYRQIMNKLLLKDEVSEGVLKSYELVIECLINNWKQQTNKEIQDLNKQMYNLSVSCKYS